MTNYIILIDDDPQFTRLFVNEAAAKKIKVSAKGSLEGLKEVLPSLAHKFAAVVLDIKCILHEGQAKEDSTFIGAALTYLDSTLPGFPRYILTGDETEFEGVKKYHAAEKMFLKTPDDKEKLFKELDECIANAEPLRLRRENPLVFEVFDQQKMTSSKVTVMLSLLSSLNEQDPLKFKGILGDVRELHEEVYKCLNKRNKAIVPDRFINNNGGPAFSTTFYKHMEGNPDPRNNFSPTSPVYQDSTILAITKFIHNSCSEFLHNSSKTNYKISPYTVKALINGIMELIIWSKKY